jgi:N-methylhydantoinase A
VAVRVGIDTGGTFTDLVGLEEATGELIIAKYPSTPKKPVDAIVGAVKSSHLNVPDIQFIILGTTVATNALLQRTGASVIFVTTQGFEDVLYIQRMNRRYHYSLQWTKPIPYVERRNCLGVRERVDAKGRVLVALDNDELEALADRLEERIARRNMEDIAIAVCFLFSYLNPEHELRVRRFLEDRFPQVSVSLSHEVAAIWREYERGSTTVADAYVKPILRAFIQDVRSGLDRLGLQCPWAIMKSNGGSAIAGAAEAQPVNLLLSGLAGGIIGGKYFGELAGEDSVVTLDMGGTSCDVGLVHHGKLPHTTHYELEWGLPVSAPFIDVHTIGAGGGSIAWIDKGGFLQVGPQSAGADPGPICYDQGGDEVTVTDANLVLGRLSPDYFLGGRISLNVEKAEAQLASFGRALSLTHAEVAQAIVDVADENMANAIRLVSIERGLDPRTYALVAFGGAGPLHAVGIAERVGVQKIIVPLYPGLCSAFGTLVADLQVDKVWSKHFRSDRVDPGDVDGQLRALVESAIDELRAEGFSGVPSVWRTISMRYAGQNYEHEVPLREVTVGRESLEQAFKDFHQLHERFYGYAISDEVIELVRFNVTAVGGTPKPTLRPIATRPTPQARQVRGVYFRQGGFVRCPVYRREDLGRGTSLDGPAVVEELDSTVLLHPERAMSVDDFGIITIQT